MAAETQSEADCMEAILSNDSIQNSFSLMDIVRQEKYLTREQRDFFFHAVLLSQKNSP